MKKILLLLMLCYSFAFSAQFWADKQYYGEDSSIYPDSICYGRGAQLGGLTVGGALSYGSTPPDDPRVSWRSGYWSIAFNWGSYNGSYYRGDEEQYVSVHVDNSICSSNYTPPPTCDPQTEVEVNGQCEVIGEVGTCPTPNIRLSDGSCSTCTTEQHYDIQQEICVNNCTPTFVENPNPTEWVDLNLNTSETCTAFLIDRQIDGTFLTADDGCGGTSLGCYGEPESPCDNLLSPSLQRPSGGYVYKGRVPNSSICSSYVDGIKYIDSRIKNVDNDCAKNDDYYCYLLPLNADNNETNTDNPLPIPNEDGTIPNDDNITSNLGINTDNNLTDSQRLNNQMLQDLKNNLQDQTLNISDYHTWFKNKFGKWEPHTDATNQLNEQKSTTSAINNVKTSTDSVKDAINNQNSNLGSKLDTINNSINDLNLSIDMTSEVDRIMNFLEGEEEDTNSTGYVVGTDFNNSVDSSLIDGLIGNFSTTWDNLKADIDSVSTDGNSLISILQSEKDGGFNLNLPHATVTTCPYVTQMDMSSLKSGWLIDISVDLCKPFSSLYPIFYVLFSIMFTVMVISFSFKSIMRLL